MCLHPLEGGEGGLCTRADRVVARLEATLLSFCAGSPTCDCFFLHVVLSDIRNQNKIPYECENTSKETKETSK